MERSNPPPKPECCLQPGPEPESLGMTTPNDLREAYTGQRRGPQAGFASGLSNSASKGLAADGDGLGMPEPNTDRGAKAEKLKCGDAEIGMGGEHGLGFSFSAFQHFSISACVFKTGSRIRP